MNEKIFLLLGSNIGNRLDYLTKAKLEISTSCGKIITESSVYETEAWGITDQNAFLNQVVEIRSNLLSTDLLSKLLSIEEGLGRQRSEKWASRVIDLDILFYGKEVINTAMLTLPHPQIQNRRFTLVPLVEIARDFLHPILEKTCWQLLNDCVDQLEVRKFL